MRARGVFANFLCNKGFVLVGERYAKCKANGTWDVDLPHCVSKFNFSYLLIFCFVEIYEV